MERAAYQQMLRSVTYQNVANIPILPSRTISFQEINGSAHRNTIAQSIQMHLVDRPSVIAGVDSATLVFTEKKPATAIASELTVSDPDSDYLFGAKIQITGNYHEGQDRLCF